MRSILFLSSEGTTAGSPCRKRMDGGSLFLNRLFNRFNNLRHISSQRRHSPVFRPVSIVVLLSLFFTLPSILRAAATQNVDIKVSINASRSLALNTSDYYYGALAVGISSVSAAPIVVTNDSGGLLESYAMSAGDAISDTGIIDWTLNQTVVSTDTYRLGAQFSATPPPNSDLNWDSSDYLSKTLQPCTSTQFGNGNASQSGANVSSKTGFKTRTLWFRIHTPDQVTDGGGHTAHVTISVQ